MEGRGREREKAKLPIEEPIVFHLSSYANDNRFNVLHGVCLRWNHQRDNMCFAVLCTNVVNEIVFVDGLNEMELGSDARTVWKEREYCVHIKMKQCMAIAPYY